MQASSTAMFSGRVACTKGCCGGICLRISLCTSCCCMHTFYIRTSTVTRGCEENRIRILRRGSKINLRRGSPHTVKTVSNLSAVRHVFASLSRYTRVSRCFPSINTRHLEPQERVDRKTQQVPWQRICTVVAPTRRTFRRHRSSSEEKTAFTSRRTWIARSTPTSTLLHVLATFSLARSASETGRSDSGINPAECS